ncbi:ABC transporter permease [Paenisporosarcina sp. TG20]|uniref:ABC transporter permease n=1 Tax=Paenisporosarcina sp. TG20 TaxID=1211706 RepID=UPI00031CFB99|nr:ABC transporter permease [Paenisporosarcina sp. TG20]
MSSKIESLSQQSKWKVKNRIHFPKKLKVVLYGSVIPAFLLLVWQILSMVGVFERHLMPAPTLVLEKIISMVADGTLWAHIGVTLLRILIGFTIGVVFAVVLGSVIGYLKRAEQLMDPLIQGFRAIPSLAWVPLFILWMGIGESSKIMLIAVGVFFPVYLNIVSGIQGVDRKLIEVGKIYNFTPFQLIRKVILPASLPSFFTGIRSGLGLGWMFVVAAELMGASKGIGYLLVVGQNTYSPDLVLASIVMIAILGKLTDSALKAIESKSLHWQDSFGKQS